VKAGSLHANYVRDLRGVIEREKAVIGVLIAMEQPMQPMRSEAASAGFYQAPWGKAYSRIQLLTVADLLSGKTVDFPRENVTFKKAPKAEKAEIENQKLPF
jgi:site-specific DNA-methyltransferase (adenine-specific)